MVIGLRTIFNDELSSFSDDDDDASEKRNVAGMTFEFPTSWEKGLSRFLSANDNDDAMTDRGSAAGPENPRANGMRHNPPSMKKRMMDNIFSIIILRI